MMADTFNLRKESNEATMKQNNNGDLIRLSKICRDMKADPHYVRMALRALGMTKGKSGWYFTKADAEKIAKLIETSGIPRRYEGPKTPKKRKARKIEAAEIPAFVRQPKAREAAE